MPIETADIVIVGGAVVGSSIAWHLKRQGHAGRVVVVERDPSYQWCATGRSVASVRQQFSTPENIRLSQYGVEVFRHVKQMFGPEADVSFRERGYLIMASPEGRATLARNVALQQSLGADIALLEPGDIARRFPWIAAEGLGGAGWGRSGEGWVDPHALLQLFAKGAQAAGVTYVADEAVGIDTAAGRITGVRLRGGARIATGTVVCAAGWHSAKVATLAGVALPVRPRKRYVFVLDCPTELPGAGLTIDPSGVYFRPEGRYHLAGIAPPETADPDAEDFDIEPEFFEREVWPRLAARVPAFETLKLRNSWCCHYDVTVPDHNAVLGPHPDLPDLVLACGFSGHGLQHSPGVGRGIAEWLQHGRWQTLDLSRFGLARLTHGEPIVELNVF